MFNRLFTPLSSVYRSLYRKNEVHSSSLLFARNLRSLNLIIRGNLILHATVTLRGLIRSM